MKKMFFSAIAMIAFAGSTFASNEVVKEVDVNNNVTIECLDSENIIEEDFVPCSVSVGYYINGRYVTDTFHSEVANGSGCADFLNDIVKGLKGQGFNITDRIAVSGVYDRTLKP